MECKINGNESKMVELYLSLTRNYKLVLEEKDKTKQENYLSNINSFIKKIHERTPKEIQENIKKTIDCVEENISKRFSKDFPELVKL
ncbi:hypothetical protein KAI04_04990 [Candidatus Pacearchaeota archaeon]|nr:hypothetical protein [Candidatus Pacearchaeota archaeon]